MITGHWGVGENGELFFNGYRVLVLLHEKLLDIGCMTMHIDFTLLNYTLKIIRWYILLYVLSHLKIFQKFKKLKSSLNQRKADYL